MDNTSQVTPSTNQVDANQPSQSQAPQTPQASPAQPQPNQATQPNQNQAPSPSAQPQNQPTQVHPVSKVFNKILTTMTGGPVSYTDANGVQRQAPQSNSTLARSIVAAALAGLMTPDRYRQGAFGTQVRDYSGTMADSFNAGKQSIEAFRNKPQQMSDDQQTRKLATIQNNVNLAQQMAALTHQKHAVLQDIVDRNQTFLKPIQDYDSNRPSSDPSIFAAQGLSSDEVMKSGHSLMDHNVIVDGVSSQQNPETGTIEEVPTYSVIRDGATLQLPKEVTDELGKFNRSYEKAYQLTGGNVKIPVGQYIGAVHQANTLTSVEHFLTRAQNEIDPKGKSIDLAAEFKKNPSLMTAINGAESALAGGAGNDSEGGSTAEVVERVLQSKNGADLLGLIAPIDKVSQFVQDKKNDAIAAQSKAKAAGTIENTKTKAALKPMTLSDAMSVAADPNETPERKQQAQNVITEKKAFDQAEATWKSQLAAAKANTNMLTGSMPDGTQVAGTQDELAKAGATGVTKLPAADSSKVSVARQLISPNGLLTNTLKDVAAFKPEELTAIGNRWNEFEAGTLGLGDPRYVALRTDAKLLSTALMQAHVGSKGSEGMMEHFANLADAGKMSGDTLKTALETEKRYVTEKAMLPHATPTQVTQPQTKPQTDPAAAFGGKTRQ